MYSEEIEKLEMQHEDNKKEIQRLTQENANLFVKVISLLFKVKEGTLVKTKNGKIYRVHSISYGSQWGPHFIKPTLLAHIQKKDGTFSNVIHRLFKDEWEVNS